MGLNPKFILPLQLYHRAAVDRRAGMSGTLIGTITPGDALEVIELYGEHLPTPHDKQRVFETIQMIDGIATRERGKREADMAEQASAEAKAKR